jgi:hypothetical protein
MKQKNIDLRLLAVVFAATAGLSAVPACGENGVGDAIPGGDALLEECGLTCDARGVAEGNASISGNVKVDAFFGSVVNFTGKANLVAGNIEAELAKIRASLELDADASAAEIKAAMVAKFSLDADAAITVKYQPAECSVSAKATLEAQARCEGTVTPPNATVECQGSCQAEAGVEVDCGAEAEVKCVGTAPNLECEGSCTGSCELTAAATCEGTCKGTCSGTCSVENADGSCAGACDGMCEGTCELQAGGSCSGSCKGECEYTPPSGECEANAEVHCEAMGSATVECSGKCEGEVTPPMASAECQASAKADASVNVDCTPPSLDLAYSFDASLDAEARAEAQANFEAFLVGFKGSFSAIVAELGRADAVIKAGASLTAAAGGAVEASVDASLEGDLSLKAAIGLGCALDELPAVATVITEATENLEGSVSGAVELTGAFTSS